MDTAFTSCCAPLNPHMGAGGKALTLPKSQTTSKGFKHDCFFLLVIKEGICWHSTQGLMLFQEESLNSEVILTSQIFLDSTLQSN